MRTVKGLLLIVVGLALVTLPAFGQGIGSISGTVTTGDGVALPGTTVKASGDTLPRAREVVTDASGRYRFEGLPPGTYSIEFESGSMDPVAREAIVALQANTVVDVVMSPEAISETVQVIGESPVIDLTSAELKANVSEQVINKVPIGQEYRDLMKLIPGVQYSEDNVRGPSAGGNGQDNVYNFDGVDVGLPLFGTLSSEPSTHDIDQVSIVKGGAPAIDFNRSGGFTMNSISRSGTNLWKGLVSYQVQTEGMTGDRDTGLSEFDQDRDWGIASIGGPVLSDRLFFYGSYYRPTTTRDNRSNVYGDVPNSKSVRDEFFGKLTWNITDSFLLTGSYRDSTRDGQGGGVGGLTTGTASTGSDATQRIALLEGNWVTGRNGFFNFRIDDFENETSSAPDNQLGFQIAIDGSVSLDVDELNRQGLLAVPQPLEGEDDYNAFIDPLIQQYGFSDGGQQVGGGNNGVGTTFNDQDFFRESYQLGYDYMLGSGAFTHELHGGYRWYKEQEDLSRTSNGWGFIQVPGGRVTAPNGETAYYEARFQQQSLLGVIPGAINSQFQSQNIEINDVMQWNDWTFNIGFMVSDDDLYGEGLRPNSSNSSGFELAPGNRYKMKNIGFGDQFSPRLGATWSFNGRDTVYANFARYYPAASSLPRAASWARNLRREIRGYFDASGNLIDSDPVRSSSGKFFQAGISPRSIDEFLLGYSKQVNSQITTKVHGRYRDGKNFWEDTNNTARIRYEPPPGIPRELYIPELDEWRDEVGGSSYVIAELDDAYTQYYELSAESEWRTSKAFVRGSYVWSHYYGNFDQDNTTTSNDAATFVGSSFIADGAGRQLWNFREGNLRGDRRNQVKIYGFYQLPWNASTGGFFVWQDGQPWEAWDVEIYREFTSSSSDTSRYAEPAGSRTTDAHNQLDINYTQNFKLGQRFNFQLRGDIFNVFDSQTGYNVQNKVNSAAFGAPRSFFDPRRFQLMVRFEF